jgi:hypothetical protein
VATAAQCHGRSAAIPRIELAGTDLVDAVKDAQQQSVSLRQ